MHALPLPAHLDAAAWTAGPRPAFRNADDGGRFVGGITDPMLVEWDGGRLRVTDAVSAIAEQVAIG
ncbi:hypothetical protein [Microbacterium sp. E-13]|uniref:hypothetical protein n=1 Tax=Microbacterium sp. E-13 TaxID=3404048 RepID=UPI003CEDF7EC